MQTEDGGEQHRLARPGSLQTPKVQHITVKPRNLRLFLIVALLVLLGLISWQGFRYYNYQKLDNQFPTSLRKQVSFQLYYPSTLSEGYKFVKEPASVENNIVFYSLQKENHKIVITQQAAPLPAPDLKSIPGFGEVPTVLGQAVSGSVNKVPVAILLTKTTLINIRGSEGVSQQTLSKLAQSMSPLPE